uniref:Uncharacterized protein n=1 Tax=Brassica campestris TaxID=3711 RepID=M4DWD7_BRACM
MAITKKMLVAIIFSIFFIVSSVHCSDRTLDCSQHSRGFLGTVATTILIAKYAKRQLETMKKEEEALSQ